jgi:hypothetical protein
MYRKLLPTDLVPYPTGDSAAEAARQILLEGLAPYFSLPEGSPGRNQICAMISAKLGRIYPEFHDRTVLLWFIEHRGLLTGDLSANDAPHACDKSPRFPGTLSPPTAEGRVPPGVRHPFGGAEEAEDGRRRRTAICSSCDSGGDGDRRGEVAMAGRMAMPGGEVSQAAARFRPAATESPHAMATEAVRAGPLWSGAAPSGAVGAAALDPADSEYARATTHTGFRLLMSHPEVALSLINSVLESVISGFQRLGDLEFVDPTVRFGEGETVRLDLLVACRDGRSVMIDLQTPAEDCMPRETLLSAASAFRDRRFPARECGGGKREYEEDEEEDESTADDSPCSAERDVYVIQIVNSDSREAPGEAGRDRGFLHGAPAVCVDTNDGIHLIQIELARIHIGFPVKAEVTFRWTDLEWWYYLLKFAGEFTDKELERCRDLYMADPVLLGFVPLRRQFWPAQLRDEYRREVTGVGPSVEVVTRRRPKREKPVGLHRQLRRLIKVFLKTGSLTRQVVSAIEERFSVKLVREIWTMSRDPRNTEELYVYFVRTLERNELIAH